jgi:hypothetical protein
MCILEQLPLARLREWRRVDGKNIGDRVFVPADRALLAEPHQL